MANNIKLYFYTLLILINTGHYLGHDVEQDRQLHPPVDRWVVAEVHISDLEEMHE